MTFIVRNPKARALANNTKQERSTLMMAEAGLDKTALFDTKKAAGETSYPTDVYDPLIRLA